jgi:lipid-A-disaccharide synthase
LKIFIITGEKSGDMHAANLVKEIKCLNKNLKIKAWGGDRLINEGVDVIKHINSLSFMGFLEVLKNIFSIKENLDLCKRNIIDFNPDLILLVDYAGFNLRIAEFASKKNYKVYYYISPKLWAWKSSRIKAIKKYITKMIVIFPFEKDYYKKNNYEVEYFGNPLIDELNIQKSKSIINSSKSIISIFPGSRFQEIIKILPVMLSITDDYPNHKFIVAGVSSFNLDFYKKIINNNEVDIVFEDSYRILRSSKVALITSGTASLEAALLNVPQVVCYKTSFFSYFIAKYFIRIKYISLVNILNNKSIVSELIQFKLTKENLLNSLNDILNKKNASKLNVDYSNTQKMLALNEGSPSKDIANFILKTI